MTTLKINELVKSSDLYLQAFTHKSFSKINNFERLEFLGDAIIGVTITELLYKRFPLEEEGSLSRWRSALVSQENLAIHSKKLDLSNLLVARSSELEMLRKNERIQASLLESFIGAYSLIEGMSAAQELLSRFFKDDVERAQEIFSRKDAKTLYQEIVQKILGQTPVYKVLKSSGPSHKPLFIVGVFVGAEKKGEFSGDSIKKAETGAARKALNEIKKEEVL